MVTKMDLVRSFGHLPLVRILLQMSSRAAATASPPYFISSAGTLSIPADLLFFKDLIALLTLDVVIFGAGELGAAFDAIVFGYPVVLKPIAVLSPPFKYLLWLRKYYPCCILNDFDDVTILGVSLSFFAVSKAILEFLVKFPSISRHCSLIHISRALLIAFLTSLFTVLYLSRSNHL